MIDVNFASYVFLTKHALPQLRRSRGTLVVVSSVAGQIPVPYVAFYSAQRGKNLPLLVAPVSEHEAHPSLFHPLSTLCQICRPVRGPQARAARLLRQPALGACEALWRPWCIHHHLCHWHDCNRIAARSLKGHSRRPRPRDTRECRVGNCHAQHRRPTNHGEVLKDVAQHARQDGQFGLGSHLARYKKSIHQGQVFRVGKFSEWRGQDQKGAYGGSFFRGYYPPSDTIVLRPYFNSTVSRISHSLLFFCSFSPLLKECPSVFCTTSLPGSLILLFVPTSACGHVLTRTPVFQSPNLPISFLYM